MRLSTLALWLGSAAATLALATARAGADEATPAPKAQGSAWSQAQTPAQGPARSIGGYSSGCVQGAQPLPRESENYRVMRPERRRHYGHPALIGFVSELARRMHETGLEPLAIGDLGQARGGPAPNGHASHQNGLDVDLWFAAASPGPVEQHSVVDLEKKAPNEHFGPRVGQLLELSARDERVARIFVNAVIKKRLCETAEGDRSWLRKLRPWYGHHEHFHVRLACPDASSECQPQSPIPAGDGCDGVDWWLSEETEKDRHAGGSKYQKRVGAKPKLPDSCTKLVD